MISILCPSRGRPKRLQEMVDSIEDTAENPKQVEVVVGLDLDDQAQYADVVSNSKVAIKTISGPRPKYMSDLYNTMLKASEGSIVCYCADDVVFGARGWDSYAEEAFKANPVLLLYDSGQDRDECPIHGFVSRASCDCLGFLFPEGYEHGYVDRWLWAVYREIRRNVWTYKVRMHHRHWHEEKSRYDATYEARSVAKDENGLTCDDRDKIKFNEAGPQIQIAVEKLRRLRG